MAQLKSDSLIGVGRKKWQERKTGINHRGDQLGSLDPILVFIASDYSIVE